MTNQATHRPPSIAPTRSSAARRWTVVLLIAVAAAGAWSTRAHNEAGTSPPAIAQLFSNSIAYLRVPDGSTATVTVLRRTYQYEDARFDVYDPSGAIHRRIVFECESPNECQVEPGEKQVASFARGGTYKLVAYGPRFIYRLDLDGPESDEWGLVVLGIPHKPPFRLASRRDSLDLYFRAPGQFTLYAMSEKYDNPPRQHLVTVRDDSGAVRARLRVDSSDVPASFEASVQVAGPDGSERMWRATIADETGTSVPVPLGIWVGSAKHPHPLGPATLLAPAPQYYFEPSLLEREAAVSVGEQTGRLLYPGSDGIANRLVDPEDELYEPALERFAELRMKTIKHYTSWYWREGPPRERRNDNDDPEDLDWSGFNMAPFEARMAWLEEIGVRPLLCLDWASIYPEAQVDFVGAPHTWGPEEMAEYAEFVEAIVTSALAPDLVEPPVERPPYDIVGVQLMGEPNLTTVGPRHPVNDRDLILEQYLEIFGTVLERLRAHPDPRVRGVRIYVPGVAVDVWGVRQSRYWISRLVERFGDDIWAVGWDPYDKYFLEELANYKAEVADLRELLDARGVQAEIGFSEFGIHGGPPTFDNVYGSAHSRLYLFGTIASAAGAGLGYPYYFSTFDGGSGNFKGLMGSADEPVWPYTRYTTLERKPQFYSMQAVGAIAEGELLSLAVDGDQLDALASQVGDEYRIGIQNRYEAATSLELRVPRRCALRLERIDDDGPTKIASGRGVLRTHRIQMDPWSLYVARCTATKDGGLYLPLLEVPRVLSRASAR